ncbi:BrnA antitoxin of type II toxin-antitoxin system [Jannaschia faecimaris]|uniref:BrnA antitoxin of type II toxin-antitoxin system n=1 Tax=Jannaschia faecimaris TaxID=1244108 RepID=A0A1H3RBC2_9RHOB|nr:BrnA antitoxin family protein [Jannaschia faecimaris]SDZ22940.1 BrnA antitoxin of type II toxin-antitoxin system [Jannaschia faecimaris]
MATKSAQKQTSEMIAMMMRFQWDMAHAATRAERVPEDWRQVWQNRSQKKRKVSLYVDEDVYKLFRSMGAGMGPRMNTVLSAFVRARLAGLLEGEDLVVEAREAWMGKPKPTVGEIMARLE